MAHLVLPADDLKRIIAQRRRHGLDRYDEVWDGVYVMAPIANDEHQELATWMSHVFMACGLPEGTRVRAGINVTDRHDDWTKNYRVSDVAVFLPDTRAVCRDTHWLGGPDFAVEIRSKGDRSRKKLPFYAATGTRELLLVNRDPWSLELFRLEGSELRLAGCGTVENGQEVSSEVLGLSFGLSSGSGRPLVVVRQSTSGETWTI